MLAVLQERGLTKNGQERIQKDTKKYVVGSVVCLEGKTKSTTIVTRNSTAE